MNYLLIPQGHKFRLSRQAAQLSFILALIIVPFQVWAEELSTADFSTGYYLEVEGTGPIYSLELPLEVYRTVRRPDLGDIRVFNGAGEVVPHGLRSVAVEPETVRQNENIPFFPLYESNAAVGRGDLAMRVTRNTTGTIVSIEAGPKQGSDAPRVTGYLLDLSGLKWPLGEMAFDWQVTQESTVFNMSLQHSNDMQHWSPLVAATLVDLQHGGQRVEKRTIPLSFKPQKYLLLTRQGGGSPLGLTQVTGYSQIFEALQRRQWTEVTNGVVHSGEKGTIVSYETTFRLPVSSAQMVFHDKNTLARIALQSRASDKDSWRTRCEQVFYTLGFAAAEVRNEPCVFFPTADHLWRAVVREDGAGIGGRGQAPTLELGWNPSELLFLGRGSPPFLLAFGSARLENQEGKEDSRAIFQAANNSPAKQVVAMAVLGKRIELSGDRALQPLPPPTPWKKWLLWILLFLGVGLLALMARSLIREMNNKTEKRTTEEG